MMYRQAFEKIPAATPSLLFVCVLFVGAFVSARWFSAISSDDQKRIEAVKTALAFHPTGGPEQETILRRGAGNHPETFDPSRRNSLTSPIINGSSSPSPSVPAFHPASILRCDAGNRAETFDPSRRISLAPPIINGSSSPPPSPSSTCPDYFRWIHEDLRPWSAKGISRETVESAKKLATFRLVVLNGSVYVEQYHGAFQTRDVFTQWGFLQLMRRYPGRLPDLDLMFACGDPPSVSARDYEGSHSPVPPPLFGYCSNADTLDLVLPDWSFWGWPEINIKPWVPLAKELEEANQRLKWMDREPHAYWKGNPYVSPRRHDLLKCNGSRKKDWNARLYVQDWVKESREGFKQSNLASQCIHRFKIYIEGVTWSVSQKYILACNSLTLLVKPRFYDFFTRGLMPMQHYWPIRENDKCRSIKFAVDWGNKHKTKAQEIGKAASEFIQEKVKMDYVYDYMFHLLNEYSKLLTYRPTIPPHATKYTLESMACHSSGLIRKFMMESMVIYPKDSNPCTLPPPFDPAAIRQLNSEKENSIKQVESWEEKAWRN